MRIPLVVAAADIGGSKVLAVTATAAGAVLSEVVVPTAADEGREAVLSNLFSALHQAIARAGKTAPELAGIGIACAGLIGPHQGEVITSPHLPHWSGLPLRERTQTEFGVPVWVANDANAAALGEYRYGAGRGRRHLICITVGTGIGGGIVLNGSLYTGAGGTAGEIGHMTIDTGGPPCACGNLGCLEALASGSVLATEARLRLRQGEPSALSQLCGGNPDEVTAELIHRAAIVGDALSLKLIARAGNYLGVGLANLVNLFNPEVIVVGGGLSKMGELLLSPARETMQQRAFPFAAEGVEVVPAQLGDKAGAMGMVALIVGEQSRKNG